MGTSLFKDLKQFITHGVDYKVDLSAVVGVLDCSGEGGLVSYFQLAIGPSRKKSFMWENVWEVGTDVPK